MADAWAAFEEAKRAASVEAAACRARDLGFAQIVLSTVGIMAQQYPQELRKALSDVFSPFELEARYERLECRLNIAAAQQGELIDTLNRVEDRLKDMEKRLNHLESPPPTNGRMP